MGGVSVREGEWPTQKRRLGRSIRFEQDGEMASHPLPYVFEFASNLKADPKKVMTFHLDPKNIARISPCWIQILALESPARIVEGSKIRLRVRSLGLPQSWDVTVAKVVDFSGSPAKASLLDVAEKGPFPYWSHLHEFWAAPDGTTGLVDRVEFLPPGGFLGILALSLIRRFFEILFRARHEATRKILEST